MRRVRERLVRELAPLFLDGTPVVPDPLDLCRELADADKVLPQLADVLPEAVQRHQDRRRAILLEELTEVSRAVADTGVAHVLLRGFGLQAHYPEGLARQFNDLDMAVRTTADLALLLGAVRPRGYYLARPIVLRRAGAGAEAWAGVALNRRHDDLGHPVYLDVVVAGPAVSQLTHWAIPAAVWDELAHIAPQGVAVPVLPTSWALVALVVELTEREEIVARDVLDVIALWRAGADAAVAAHAVAALGLQPQVTRLADLAAATGHAPLGAFLDALGASDGRGLRARVAAHDGPALLRQRGPGALPALALTAVGGALDRAAARDRARALRLNRRLDAAPAYRAGLPVYLLPALPGEAGLAAALAADAAALAGAHVARVRPLVGAAEFRARFPEAAALRGRGGDGHDA